MNVVQSDVAGEPVQRARQLIIGGAEERRDLEVPTLSLVPGRLFELMLNEEKPAPGGRG